MRDDGTMMRRGDMGCPDAMTAANSIWITGARREGRTKALRWLGWLAAIAVVVAVLTIAFDARAQVAQGRTCGDRDMFLKRLEERYNEVPSFYGIDSNGAIVEILVSPVGTWTVLITEPGRPTCAVAAGKSWSSASGPPGDPT